MNRFISVGTENTTLESGLQFVIKVHLRGYGEHSLRVIFIPAVSGSSPWVRRTLIAPHESIDIERFISVGTENTDNYHHQ